MARTSLARPLFFSLACAGLGLIAGCGDDASPSPGTPDAASQDAASQDAGTTADAGTTPDAAVSPDAPSIEPPSIVGAYDTNFGGFVRVTETGADFSWYADGDVVWTTWSNEEQYLIGQNASTDPFNPDRFSRFDFAEVDGILYWCQTAFDAADEAAALSTPRADDSDPATMGCGGAFAWTALTPGQGPLPLVGTWSDPFGQIHDVSATQWITDDAFTYELLRFDNANEFAIAQNGEGTGDAEGAYSRFDWTWVDGVFWYCQIAFDAASEAAAEAVDTANRDALSTDGCNGFSWSELTVIEDA